MSPNPDLRTLAGNQHGIALISSLLLTLLLTLVVIALAYRVQLFSVGTRDHVTKSQNLYTADTGLNQARYFLLDKDCAMTTLDEWKCSNGSITIGSNYSEITNLFQSTFLTDLALPVSDKSIRYDRTKAAIIGADNEQYTYRVYAKASGMQDVISVMTVAERTGDPSKTVIDAGLKFNVKLGDDSIKTKNQSADGSGDSKESIGESSLTTMPNFISH